MNTFEILNLVIAAVALIISVISFIYTSRETKKVWQHTQIQFEQNTIPELDIMLEDGEWEFNKPLILHVINLGQAPAKNVNLRIGGKVHGNEDSPWWNFGEQPFSLLGGQSNGAQKDLDIANTIRFLLSGPAGVVKHATSKYGVLLLPDAKKTILVVRIECEWESGVRKVEAKQMLKKYYCLFSWRVMPYLTFDNEHLQWYITGYDIINNKPASFYENVYEVSSGET